MPEAKDKEVVAIAKAYHDDQRVEVGARLTVPADFKASWAVDAKDYEPASEPTEKEKVEKAKEGLQGRRKAKK